MNCQAKYNALKHKQVWRCQQLLLLDLWLLACTDYHNMPKKPCDLQPQQIWAASREMVEGPDYTVEAPGFSQGSGALRRRGNVRC
jgi:hypothetical protein